MTTAALSALAHYNNYLSFESLVFSPLRVVHHETDGATAHWKQEQYILLTIFIFIIYLCSVYQNLITTEDVSIQCLQNS